jgi:PhzF family phenazine biosynthesis protein
MRNFPFKKIDAFASAKSGGNPAGYIRLDSLSEISETEMLQIAKELKGFVSEVGFATRIADTEFDLRYYSSEREVDFCGHATIAIMYDIIKTNPSVSLYDSVTINTKHNKLTVQNRIADENAVFIMSPNPVYKDSIPDIEQIALNLKIQNADINTEYPVSIINAGLNTLIIPIKDLDTITAIKPDLDELNIFCRNSGVDIIHVFTGHTFDKSNNYRTRVFAPTFGYLEDPATGSGNSAFGYYLIKNRIWADGTLLIEQNSLKEKYNLIRLQIEQDEQKRSRVCFGGSAITRIEGQYLLY